MAFTQKVRSDNGSQEGRYLLLGIALLLIGGVIALPFNQRPVNHVELSDYQIRVDQLNPEKQMLLSQLKLAHEEVIDLYEETDGEFWPDVPELESLFLAPFVKDLNWQSKGELAWRSLDNGFYLGTSPLSSQQFAAVLLDSRAENEAQIWLHTLAQTTADDDLPQQGWQQVVFVKSPRQVHLH